MLTFFKFMYYLRNFLEGMIRILTLFFLISMIDAVLPPKVVLQKRETVPEYEGKAYSICTL